MMKSSFKFPSKSEKGQVLVIVALTIVILVGIIGLAVDSGYLYLRYSDLNRAVDSAALAASGEFKNYNDDNLRDSYIRAAAKQLLDLNSITPDTTASFSDPVILTRKGFSVETCHKNNGDATVVAKLCEIPLQKIVRVTVQEQVPLFFLKVLPGAPASVPIQISSYSTAASLDAMLVLDTSASMADGPPETLGFGDPPDPNACNLTNQCEPMAKVKTAAAAFSNAMYYPYDHVGLVGFDQTSTLYLSPSSDGTAVQAAISSLIVYEGAHSPLTDGTSPTKCIFFQGHANAYEDVNGNGVYDLGIDNDISNPNAYRADYPFYSFHSDLTHLDDNPPAPAIFAGDATARYLNDKAQGPCRLFDFDSAHGGAFVEFWCPMYFGTDPDPSNCGTTNLHDAIQDAGNALKTYGRDSSVWALVLLSDGRATAAHYPTGSLLGTPGSSLCPHNDWPNKNCRDTSALVRHCMTAADYVAIGDSSGYSNCMNAKYPADSLGNSIGSSTVDTTNYDVDDAARDAFDLVAGNSTLVFTIGLGNNIPYPAVKNGVEPGETLLNYGASVSNGAYIPAQSSSDLTGIFLQIAKMIVSRINQ